MLSLVSNKQVFSIDSLRNGWRNPSTLAVLAMQVILASLTKSNQSMKATLIIIGIYTLFGAILQIIEIQTEKRSYASFNHRSNDYIKGIGN